MHSYQIVEPKPVHAGMLALRMRPEDRAELINFGFCDVRRTLRRLMLLSTYCRSALIDGEMAAMWGVSGSFMGYSGKAWLFTGQSVEKLPLAFFREARREVNEMLVGRSELVSQVLFSYERSIRFFRMLGFEIENPLPIGVDGAYYCRMSIKRGTEN
jgi:hypothetical protein